MSRETPGLEWPQSTFLPTFQTPAHMQVYDLRGASRDAQLAATTLAGLVNRPQPHVYLILNNDDAFWLTNAAQTVSHDLVSSTADASFDALVIACKASIKGLIIYDPALLDTINVATTLAGQRDGIVVSPTLAQHVQSLVQLPVLQDLRTFGWKMRLQAYLWAQQNLLGEASSHFVAGLDPTALAGLRSFLVATRTFVYWLDSRKYVPDFSAGTLSERALMVQLLQSFAPGAVHLGWFIDESSGVNLTSIQAMVVLASDYFTNLEVWSAIRPQAPFAQPHEVATPAVSEKVYLSFTISDGDNLQYMQHRMLHLWNDTARGSLPIGWTFSPPLIQAAPALAAYYAQSATANDELIAGPSGAGYMFPSHWPTEQLTTFLQQTGELMQALHMTTLEVLDTNFWQSAGIPFISNLQLTGMVFTDAQRQQQFVQALTPYGLRGLLSGAGVLLPKYDRVEGTPIYRNLGLASSVNVAVKMIQASTLLNRRRPFFLNVYILAWALGPSDLVQIVQQLGDGYEIVLPKTLLAMLENG